MRKRETFVPLSKAKATKKAPYVPSLAYMDLRIDPEQIQIVRTSTSSARRTQLPVDKTEDEIERLYAYNVMMGRA